MIILIQCSGMPFDGTTIPSGESLGGSETACYYMAKGLADMGHKVTVFTAKEKPEHSTDGVIYEWHGKQSEQAPLGSMFHQVSCVPHDVCIVQRTPYAFHFAPQSKLNIWWLHDIALKRSGSLVDGSLPHIDKIFTVSDWHKNQVSDTLDIPKDFIHATHNGVDYSLFEGLEDAVKEEGSLIFTSRPERGLEALVKEGGIMERLSECHLYVCGYDNCAPQMRGYYDYLYGRCDTLPNVTNIGFLGKKELYIAEAKAMIHVMPTTFEDTSNIACVEANASGTPWVSFKSGAVPETMKEGGAVLLDFKGNDDPRSKCIDDVDIQRFADACRNLLKDKQTYDSLVKKGKAKHQDWDSACREWTQLFESMLAKKCDDPLRMFNHLERMSDIVAIETSGLQSMIPEELTVEFNDNYEFYLKDNFAEHYKNYYDYERDVKGVKYGKEDLMNPSTRQRFMATMQLLEGLKPSSVLDYGTAHGHYPLNLAPNMPDTSFTGIDITQSNIDIAKAWADADSLSDRVSFICGEHGDVDGKFDVVMACEVLEHVADPQAVVTELMTHLNPGGSMLLSVPYGAWEAEGYYDPLNEGWRAHLHHFERQDLVEIFSNQDEYNVIAVPFDATRGHLMVTFKPNGQPLGQIDYNRKLKQQSPQQTLSVCMIVKDSEDSLGKCLKKVGRIADEIIIGLDNTTSDGTREIAERFQNVTIIDIESPVKQGFDNARNETIKVASCDWIMWIDDDETLENGEAIRPYLRENCFNGYAIQQHHYAVEPPALFQTDYPIRIFRNNKDIRFYGHVHEHPEQGLNKGMGKVLMVAQVSIMHTGYSMESIRRDRFTRNFPLMQIDRKRFPERTLGKFLWLRDLSHVIRYEMEQNGNQILQHHHGYAQVMIEIWRELLDRKELRMVRDGLRYYSHAVEVLGGGIEYKMNQKAGLGNVDLNGGEQHGLFQTSGDIKKFTESMTGEQVDVYADRYF